MGIGRQTRRRGCQVGGGQVVRGLRRPAAADDDQAQVLPRARAVRSMATSAGTASVTM